MQIIITNKEELGKFVKEYAGKKKKRIKLDENIQLIIKDFLHEKEHVIYHPDNEEADGYLKIRMPEIILDTKIDISDLADKAMSVWNNPEFSEHIETSYTCTYTHFIRFFECVERTLDRKLEFCEYASHFLKREIYEKHKFKT